jgi:outer membrane protein TolC
VRRLGGAVSRPGALLLLACLSLTGTSRVRAQAESPAAPTHRLPPEDGEARLRRLLAGSGGLTSDEVARRAVAASREVASRRAGAGIAKAKEDQATAGFWPRLQMSARYTRFSHLDPVFLPGGVRTTDPADLERDQPRPLRPDEPLIVTPRFPIPLFDHQGLIQATLSVPVSDYLLRLGRATRAAARTTRAARHEEEAARRKVAADARIAYYDWIRARGQVLVTEDRLRAVSEHVKDARRLFEAGFASRADVLRAESQEKALALLLTRARNVAALAEEALRVAMQDHSGQPYEVGEDLLAPPPVVPGMADTQILQDEAREKRPELAALAETEAAIRDLEILAGVVRLPRLDLVGNAQYANPNQRVFPPRQKWDPGWDVSVVLSWTPSDIPGANATAREQAARAAQLQAQRDALFDGLRLEIKQAQSAVSEADSATETTKQGVQVAEESYRVRRELFLAGKTTLVEVIEAEAELTRARLEVVDALVEARIARVRFDHAVGRSAILSGQ